MPGKPKRKAKHPASKRSKAIVRQGVAAPPATGTAAAAPVAQAPVAARPATATRPTAPSRAAAGTGAGHYPHFVPELKRIGILAAIIIVILVVLSVVLS